MRHVAFGGLDQIGDEVMPSFQLHIDLRELIFEIIAEGNQPIVNANSHATEDEHNKDGDSDYEKNAD
jgi:hypothetical protein